MAHLDHLIVPAKDRVAAAKLLAEVLGVPWAEQGAFGPFSPVYVNDGLTLDFGQKRTFDRPELARSAEEEHLSPDAMTKHRVHNRAAYVQA
jgi:hypothetical protein